MRRGSRLAILALGLAVITAGCSKDTPTAPEPTAPVTVTDTFTGTINRNGASTHSFNASAPGTVTATLTSLAPDPDIVVGFGIGIWNGTICNVTLARDQAVRTTVIYGNVNAPGQLCVRVFDVGNVREAEPTSYEVTVTHP